MIDEACKMAEDFQRAAHQPVLRLPVERVSIRGKRVTEEFEALIAAEDIYAQAERLPRTALSNYRDRR